MTKLDELLAKANRDYPIGTKYKWAHTIMTRNREIIKYNDGISEGEGLGYIWRVGKWADIITSDLEKVRQKFKIIETYPMY